MQKSGIRAGRICCHSGGIRAPTLPGGAATAPDRATWFSSFSTGVATPLGLGRPLSSRGATTPPDAGHFDRGVRMRGKGISDGGLGNGGLGDGGLGDGDLGGGGLGNGGLGGGSVDTCFYMFSVFYLFSANKGRIMLN